MRRRFAENRQRMNRGMGIPRLTSALVMLAVISMLIYRASDPATWRFLAPEADAGPQVTAKPAEAASPAGPQKPGLETTAEPSSPLPESVAEAKLEPTGPTDLDPDEIDAMEEARQAIWDGTLSMKNAEMAAFEHLITWVNSQPAPLLQERARKDAIYDNFVSNTEEMRFKLVELDLNVHRILKCEKKGPQGQDVYDVWATTKESGAWLYEILTQDLPEGMPTGASIQEKARVVGYFFKITGYLPKMARTNSRPEKAPVIVGRLIWQPSLLSPRDKATSPWFWPIALGAIAVAVIGAVGAATLINRRPIRIPRLSAVGTDLDAPPVDEWLDQAQSGELMTGNKCNNSSNNGESNSGYSRHETEGPDNGDSPRFSDDFGTLGR